MTIIKTDLYSVLLLLLNSPQEKNPLCPAQAPSALLCYAPAFMRCRRHECGWMSRQASLFLGAPAANSPALSSLFLLAPSATADGSYCISACHCYMCPLTMPCIFRLLSFLPLVQPKQSQKTSLRT